MTERPILFSGPMVRALLDGTKTQTRRVVKGIDPERMADTMSKSQWAKVNRELPEAFGPSYFCTYGQPGDRLWVRETFLDTLGTGIEHNDQDGKRQRYAFAADCRPGSYGDEARKAYELKWKPSIHMPRAASRILLEITGVRVERLQEISNEDARAEGVMPAYANHCVEAGHPYNAVPLYRDLWNAINGAGSWDANPWVWVVEFRRIER